MCVLPREKVVPVRRQPKIYPCPTCGRYGRRKRRLDRFVRSLAYGQVVRLHVFYAEYTARCGCGKYFRCCPPNVVPKADYDNLVRQAVLNRILDDGLNVERTRLAMRRDFLLDVPSGFIYDCLDWGLTRLPQAGQRRLALKHFSGLACLDELHLGDYTLLLATDPVADRIIGYSLVKINDQAHMRRFLLTLHYWGFEPKVVVTDGSNLYPAVLAEVWPRAKHQLCVSHVLQDVTKQGAGRGQAAAPPAGPGRPGGTQTPPGPSQQGAAGATAATRADEQGEGGVRVQAPLPGRDEGGEPARQGLGQPEPAVPATCRSCAPCGISAWRSTGCSAPSG